MTPGRLALDTARYSGASAFHCVNRHQEWRCDGRNDARARRERPVGARYSRPARDQRTGARCGQQLATRSEWRRPMGSLMGKPGDANKPGTDGTNPSASNKTLRETPSTEPCGSPIEQAFACYDGVVSNRAQSIGSSPSDATASLSLDELARRQQGVTPIGDFEILLGESVPGDESVEEFSASLRGWRREGNCPSGPQ